MTETHLSAPLPKMLKPGAKLEIGKIKQADEIKRSKNDRGAHSAKVVKEQLVHHFPQQPTGATGMNRKIQVARIQIEHAHACKQQQEGPPPAAAEVTHDLKEAGQAKA